MDLNSEIDIKHRQEFIDEVRQHLPALRPEDERYDRESAEIAKAAYREIHGEEPVPVFSVDATYRIGKKIVFLSEQIKLGQEGSINYEVFEGVNATDLLGSNVCLQLSLDFNLKKPSKRYIYTPGSDVTYLPLDEHAQSEVIRNAQIEEQFGLNTFTERDFYEAIMLLSACDDSTRID